MHGSDHSHALACFASTLALPCTVVPRRRGCNARHLVHDWLAGLPAACVAVQVRRPWQRPQRNGPAYPLRRRPPGRPPQPNPTAAAAAAAASPPAPNARARRLAPWCIVSAKAHACPLVVVARSELSCTVQWAPQPPHPVCATACVPPQQPLPCGRATPTPGRPRAHRPGLRLWVRGHSSARTPAVAAPRFSFVCLD